MQVLKKGTFTGRKCFVTDGYMTGVYDGMVKVILDGDVKSYARKDLKLVSKCATPRLPPARCCTVALATTTHQLWRHGLTCAAK